LDVALTRNPENSNRAEELREGVINKFEDNAIGNIFWCSLSCYSVDWQMLFTILNVVHSKLILDFHKLN